MTMVDIFAAKPLHRRLGLYDGLSVIFVDCPPEFRALQEIAKFERVSDLAGAALPAHELKLCFQFAMVFCPPEHALQRLTALKPWLIPDAPVWLGMRKEADIGTAGINKLAIEAGLLDVSDDDIGSGWIAHKLVMPRLLRPKRGIGHRSGMPIAS
jgi:hypothetical protein